MPTPYTQVPSCEVESEQAYSYPIVRPHRLLIPWSASSIFAVLSLLLNVVLVVAWLRSKEVGGLCREAFYCALILSHPKWIY